VFHCLWTLPAITLGEPGGVVGRLPDDIDR
jgi:hypothetical protein